jgi:H+/Cl- antiporter ClcA
MSLNDWRRFLERGRHLADTLRKQGVTNLRQLYQWLASVDVSTQIVSYLHSHPGLQGIIYWVAALAVGLFAVGYAWVFGEVSAFAVYLSRTYPGLLFLVSPLAFVFSWWLVVRFAPGAAGGGIPEVMAALEVDPQRAAKWTSFRTALVKVASSLSAALGGASIGREGPTIQIAAGIFYSLGMPFKKIWPSISHHSLLVAGGSAGIAAAFNTPLGGIVFAVEELSQQHFNRFKTFLISAVIVSGLVAQWILGPYLYIGYPKLAANTFTALPWALVAGVVCGVAGGYFGKALVWIQNRCSRMDLRRRFWVPVGVGFSTALIGWYLGSEVLGSGADLVTRILFEDQQTVDFKVLLGRFFAPLLSTAAGGATGVFAPSLAAGAAIGAKLAEFTASPYPNLLVLLGMAGFLSGVTRAPFTAFVLVLEMTDRHSAIFPLMMASLVASLAAKFVDSRSWYERRCEAYLKEEASPPSA